jgi:hypothetical protein
MVFQKALSFVEKENKTVYFFTDKGGFLVWDNI